VDVERIRTWTADVPARMFAALPAHWQRDYQWHWNRLQRMTPMEIVHRGVRASIVGIHRLGVGVATRVESPTIGTRPRSFIAVGAAVPAERYVEAADRLLEGRLTVFAVACRYDDLPAWNRDPKTGRVAPLVFGKTLDYRDPALVGNIKYLWEPNRHLHLVTLAQAYRLTSERRYLHGIRTQIESWLDQCPYLLGPNWSSSLELAVRLINWSLVWQLIDGVDSALFADARGQNLRERWLTSIYQHVHFIRTHLSFHSSANNHLLGELAGVYIAARTWPFWRQMDSWRDYAKRRLVHEVLIQNARDGVNREQAISYQQFVLDFMLLAALAGRVSADDFPVEYWQRLERMLEFIAALMDVGGNVPMIGDADDGYVVRLSQEPEFCPYRSLLASGAILFNRPDFKDKARRLDDKTTWLLGETDVRKFKDLKPSDRLNPRRCFPDGGYYVLGCDLESEREIKIIVDAGPLGYERIAAHGHADALAFTLAIGGREFLIDPGTYSYHTDREWREYFRGTGAHNTVSVDGQDQSVSGGNFLWTHHANARCTYWHEGDAADRFAGRHDGYLRLDDPVVHERELIFDKTQKRLEITDNIECKARHVIDHCWHFAEDATVHVDSDGAIRATKNGCALTLRPRFATRAEVHCGESSPPRGWISRHFDVKSHACTVVWRTEIEGSTSLSTLVECDIPAVISAAPAPQADEVLSLT
jgi:heparinase II/III-like protein